MTYQEKQELIRLLTLYMGEIASQNSENVKEARRQENKWNGKYHTGVKTRYEHARVLAAKLSMEVQREMKSYWEL